MFSRVLLKAERAYHKFVLFPIEIIYFRKRTSVFSPFRPRDTLFSTTLSCSVAVHPYLMRMAYAIWIPVADFYIFLNFFFADLKQQGWFL